MGDYVLDLNNCLELGVSTRGYGDVGVVGLNISKVRWMMVEKFRDGVAFQPRVDVDTFDVIGSKKQVVELIVKIISSFMLDDDLWREFIKGVRRMYYETKNDKWLSVLPYKPHEIDES